MSAKKPCGNEYRKRRLKLEESEKKMSASMKKFLLSTTTKSDFSQEGLFSAHSSNCVSEAKEQTRTTNNVNQGNEASESATQRDDTFLLEEEFLEEPLLNLSGNSETFKEPKQKISEDVPPGPGTSESTALQPASLQNDIGLFVGLGKTRPDDRMLALILEDHWQPSSGYNYPFSIHKKGNHDERRYLRKQHLEQYPWLVLSPSQRGLFCKFCPLFAKSTGGQGKPIQLGSLVREPLTKFSKLLGKQGDLQNHENSKYHQEAVQCALDFLHKHRNPESQVANQLDSYRLEQIKRNRAKLNLILKNVEFLARQNIPFRGHRDDGPLSLEDPPTRNEGNFRALLRFRVDVGDASLAEHLKSSGSRNLFISKTTQNSLIECCGEEILDAVLSRVREAKYFSCGFDETVDLAHISQVSLFLRYLWKNAVREDFVGYLDARKATVELSESSSEDEGKTSNSILEPTVTGIKLGQMIIRRLQRLGLDLANCVGISTDGCSVNTSEAIGAIQEVQKVAIHAVRCPCYNHQLNLTLSKTSKVQSVRNAFGIMGEVISFFSASSKRNVVLKAELHGQLTQLCDTRWVERHDAVLQFLTNLEKIARALEVVSEWSDVQGDPSPPKARSLLSSIVDGQFIVSLCSLQEIMALTSPLSRLFQTEYLDIQTASEAIMDTKSILQHKRSDVHKDFSEVYRKANSIAEQLGSEIRMPRIAQQQRNRPNASSDTPEEYFRRNLYIPLLDWVLEDLSSRFSDDVLDVYRLNVFLPHRMSSQPCLIKDLNFLAEKYAPILGTSEEQLQSNMIAENSLWFTKWKREAANNNAIPSNAMDAYEACELLLYPTIKTMLHILLTLPVSIASAERSFSTLRMLKSYVRSTCGENRLNGLALMYIHRDIPLDYENVISRFATKKQRKIKLLL